MSLKALLISYVLGGLTFIPLLLAAAVYYTIYTSVPVGDSDPTKRARALLEQEKPAEEPTENSPETDVDDLPKTRKGWLTVRRTFEEPNWDGSYVNLMRSFLDARSKDPKKSRPKDMWYVALKGKVLFLYEDEAMTDCEGAIELGGHDVLIYPEELPDGELFAKRNAICLRPKGLNPANGLPSVTKEMKLTSVTESDSTSESTGGNAKKAKEADRLKQDAARAEATNINTPWFIFVRSNIEMEDWYLALIHASDNPPQHPMLEPLRDVFRPNDMDHLVKTLDEQPDVIPMRWLNAIIGRIFFSYYRTQVLEQNIIFRLMKKVSKVKIPAFLSDINVTEVSLGNRAPMLSKPMLKELTKEGDASMEVHIAYKGEIRITIEATATINLGARFKPYTVKLALAAVVKELEGNLLIKVKRPPSSRIWYGFTQTPRLVLAVEPIVSERQITWTMILSTIESKLKEIIQESVVLPNMDDISFFDSEDYEHRGGIWADAKRTHNLASSIISMAPTSSTSTQIDTHEDEESTAPVVPKSSSTTDLPATNTPNNTAEDHIDTPASVDSAPPTLEHPPAPKTRRKSWFSAGDKSKEKADENVVRGRQPTSSTPVFSTLTSSRPKDDSPGSETGAQNDSSSLKAPSRSPSTHTREGSPQPTEDDASSTQTQSTLSTSPTPTASTSSSQATSSNSTGPSSFLATLKTRADTQNLENTAKEAMRKWGMNINWGALRKEGKNEDEDKRGIINWGAFRKEGKSEDEDSSDQGSVGPSRLGKGQTAGEKPRSSYAEVRAAVEERKERSMARTSPISIPEPGDKSSTPALAPALDKSTSGHSLKSEGTSPGIDERNTVPGDMPTKARIDVQPKAKTMTIPGIHASHRGEVQSLGNIAPPTPETPTRQRTNINGTIQGVYRLLTRPQSMASSGSDHTPKTGSSPPSEDIPISQEPSNRDEVIPRPVPPPLPPRSIATVTPVESTEAASTAAVMGSSKSTASDTLKNIAARNSMGGAPPLPPRPSTSTTMSQEVA